MQETSGEKTATAELPVGNGTADFSTTNGASTGPEQFVEKISSNVEAAKEDEEEEDIGREYPTGMKVALIMLSLYLAVFLVALVIVRVSLIQCAQLNQFRTVPSSQQPSHRSQTSSSP